MLRAWCSVGSFEGHASLRSWLYRIATNVCLNLLEKRRRSKRTMPELLGPPTVDYPDVPATEIAWLEPYPDAQLEAIADSSLGPHARYEQHEAIKMAFIAAIQYLPGRQRAALLLHDVVGWSAAETAAILGMSAVAVNSALQRARAMLQKHRPMESSCEREIGNLQKRALLDRYVRSWEEHDFDGFVALLKEDAILSMPPWIEWYLGREAIRAHLARAWEERFAHTEFRLIKTAANGEPAAAFYTRERGQSQWHAYSIFIVTAEGDSIAALTSFVDPTLFRFFGLPKTLD